MEEQTAPGIVRIAAKYGVIMGVLAFLVFIGRTRAGIAAGWVPLVADAIILVVLMVLEHREFKKVHGGFMTYPQGLACGTLLSCAAAVVASVLLGAYLWYINVGFRVAASNAMSSLIGGVVLGVSVALIVAIFTQEGRVVI